MANPNILSTTTVQAYSEGLAVTTSSQAIVTNAASSGKVYKVNSLIIANVDGSNSADITVEVFKGSTSYKLAKTVPVPADATLVIISRDNQVYLNENDNIKLTASANSDLEAICSWEQIS